jgi:hypothetical protein
MPDEPTGKRSAARWQTIDEQLRESHVKPKSALEKLIRANQNFEMLRPEEAAKKWPSKKNLRVQ